MPGESRRISSAVPTVILILSMVIILIPVISGTDRGKIAVELSPQEIADQISLSGSEPGPFTENLGQMGDGSIDLYSYGDLNFGFGAGFVRVFFDVEEDDRIYAFDMRFVDSNPIHPIGASVRPGISNYFRGSDRSSWVTGARSYDEVVYSDLWPGIDLVYYEIGMGLKYDFIVHPGGDPAQIGIEYIGIDDLEVHNEVDILMEIDGHIIMDAGLTAFQGGDHIDASYRNDNGMLKIDIGDYDETMDLVIDPLVKYSTYLGGNTGELLFDILVDEDENVYLCGGTYSQDFPTSPGAYQRNLGGSWNYDGFVTRMSPDLSTVISSTFLGGSDSDYILSLALDSGGNIYVTGITYSSNFPTSNGAFQTEGNEDEWGWIQDTFLTKFGPDLSDIEYSSYIGGNEWEQVSSIQVDDQNRAFISGYTYSNDFPNTTGAYQNEISGWEDSFVLCMEANGSALAFSTFLGGTGWDEVYDMQIDGSGDVVLAGYTDSSDFPTTDGVLVKDFTTGGTFWAMGFLAKMSGDGSSVETSTFFGNDTYVTSLTLGLQGDYYIGGETYANNMSFPLTAGAYDTVFEGRSEAFFAKVSKDMRKLPICTYIGGDATEVVNSISVDDDDYVYLSGETLSTDFPQTRGSMLLDNGENDCFITIFHEGDPALHFSSYFGTDDADDLGLISLNNSNGLYISGYTQSDKFPVTPGSYDTTFNGETDAFLSLLKLNSFIPEPPRDLIGIPGNEHVNLSWRLPVHDGNETITNYTIYRGIDPRYMEEIANIPADTTWFNVTGLENGRSYFFMVSAVNIVGIGFPTEIITSIPVTYPGVVTEFEYYWGSGFANLSWYYPLDDGGYPPIRFRLYSGGSVETLDLVDPDYNATYYNFTGLTNGDPYFFGVSAFNSFGEGPMITTDKIVPLGLPSTPGEIHLEPGESSMNLSWAPPEDTGGEDVLSYNVYGGLYPFSLSLLSSQQVEPWYIMDDLRDGYTYYATVSAVNSIGEGMNTSRVSFVPFGYPSEIDDLTISTGDGYAALSWSPPIHNGGYQEWTYIVNMRIQDGNWEVVASMLDETSYRAEPLVNGVIYEFMVSAENPSGEGPYSDLVSGMPIGAPTGVTIIRSSRGDGFISLSWSEPISDGGDPEIMYELSMGAAGEVIRPYIVLGEREINLTGLVNGRDYHVYITPMNGYLRGPSSEVLKMTPMAIPTPPRNLDAIEGDRSISLSWGAPTDDGGDRHLTYTVLLGFDPNSMQVIEETVNGTSFTVSGLLNGEVYHISVIAVSSEGSSIPTMIITASPMALPSIPLDFTAEPEDGGVELIWSAPSDNGGRNVSRYVIYRGDAPGRLFRLVTIDDRITYHDLDVLIGRNYYYSVSCINEAGEGPMTESVMATPEKVEESGSNSAVFVIVAVVIILILVIGVITFLLIRAGRTPEQNGQMVYPGQNYQYMGPPPQVQSIGGSAFDGERQLSSTIPPIDEGESQYLPPAR